jgi:phosphate starvation-inducible PhoH-like protein
MFSLMYKEISSVFRAVQGNKHIPFTNKLIMGPIKKMPSHMIGKSVTYVPRSENQKMYMDYLSNQSIPLVFGLGPAGCGKTLFACNAAIGALRRGYVDRIILTRPIFAADEELGFLPGSIEMKMDPWTRPIFDIFGEFYSKTQIQTMLRDNVIEISPLAYMRGRTFKRAFIIADEMQNSTPNQILMMTTRLGEGSRMVVTGDLKQSDRGSVNGLSDMIKRLSKGSDNDLVRYIEMENKDIQRSPIVSYLINLYDDDMKKLDKVDKVVADIKIRKEDVIGNNDAAMIPKSHYKHL